VDVCATTVGGNRQPIEPFFDEQLRVFIEEGQLLRAFY